MYTLGGRRLDPGGKERLAAPSRRHSAPPPGMGAEAAGRHLRAVDMPHRAPPGDSVTDRDRQRGTVGEAALAAETASEPVDQRHEAVRDLVALDQKCLRALQFRVAVNTSTRAGTGSLRSLPSTRHDATRTVGCGGCADLCRVQVGLCEQPVCRRTRTTLRLLDLSTEPDGGPLNRALDRLGRHGISFPCPSVPRAARRHIRQCRPLGRGGRRRARRGGAPWRLA